MAIVRAGFPVLIFAQNDETRDGVESLATELAGRRADVMVAGAQAPRSITLPTISADPILEPMLIVQSFYRMVNALALARGRNPDQPPYLHKVTETV
jgi:glucosamine--fructose-6-phosphate aminotransferase (isomerizing)